jgi:protein TonB
MMNSSFDLYQTDWLDVVFANRNKSYGAYALRSESSGIQLKALFMAIPLFVLLCLGWVACIQVQPEVLITMIGCRGIPIMEDERMPEKRVFFKSKSGDKPVDEMIKLTSRPIVVKDPLVIEPALKDRPRIVVMPPVQPRLENDLSVFTQECEDVFNGVLMDLAADQNIYTFEEVAQLPEFKGGMKAWVEFLQRNLRYPVQAEEATVQGRVLVSFVIDKDGVLTDVKVIKGVGSGCDEEAMRVIKKSPGWKAGMQNGQAVRVRYIIPISFTILQ